MKHQYLKNVATLQLDEEKCRGCGMCVMVCPHRVFQVHEKKAVIKEKDACMECGACAGNCPFGAIAVAAGVGCAFAIINGMLTGSEPSCDCGSGSEKKKSCC